MKEVFRKALPFFEKALEMNPEDRQYMMILKGLYYRFLSEPGMEAKYNAIVAELEK